MIIDKRTNVQKVALASDKSSDEEKVKEILTFLGVRPEEELIHNALGYISANSMGIGFPSIYSFIKENNIQENLHRIDKRTTGSKKN